MSPSLCVKYKFFHQCVIVIFTHVFCLFGKSTLKYVILLVAMVNERVSLISLSDFSSLVHSNARDFCALTLYPVTVANSLIRSGSFLVASLEFSMYIIIMSSVNSDRFTSFLPTWISLSFLVDCGWREIRHIGSRRIWQINVHLFLS